MAVCLGLDPDEWMKLCCRFPTVSEKHKRQLNIDWMKKKNIPGNCCSSFCVTLTHHMLLCIITAFESINLYIMYIEQPHFRRTSGLLQCLTFDKIIMTKQSPVPANID